MSTALANLPELEATLEDALKFESAYERFRLQSSLYEFVKWAWPLVEPDVPFADNWHIVEMCSVLEQLTLPKAHARRLRRVVVNVPPGTMKSLLCSVFFPAWVWTRFPEKRFICASYSSLLSNRDNLRMRDLVTNAEYQKLFPVKLHDDQNTKTRFNTDKGGYRVATSVEGGGTGEHPDYIIIDDALSAKEAQSATGRAAVIQWFKGTIATRGVGRGVNILCVAQRLHEEDLPGYLLSQGGWYHVCWPMRYMKTRPVTEERLGYVADPLDPRTEEGELLFPTLFDEKVVAQLEKDLGAYDAAGQLQQQPAPEGGGLFQRQWFKYVGARPALRKSCRGWDTAGSEGAGDYTVGCGMDEEFTKQQVSETQSKTVTSGRFVIWSVVRGQWNPGDVDLNMRETAKSDGKAVGVREEREGGASGKAVTNARAKSFVGYDYEEVSLGQNKVIRAKALRTQCAAGNVYLLRTGDASRDSWIEPFIQELIGFPTGKHDDQVDAASCAFNSLIEMPAPKKTFLVW